MHTIEANTTLVGVSELRTKMNEVRKALTHSRVILENRHKPIAVLVPLERFRQMEQIMELIEERALGYLARERDKTKDADYLSLEAVEKKLGLK